MLDKKIAFIGSGAMAEAMISGLLRHKLARPENLHASDTRIERVEELHKKFGVEPFTNNNQAANHVDVVVLSVKPQRLTEVLDNLKDAVPEPAVVVSIIAGATIEKISKGLKHEAVVRSMPNTPAQIGEGITVWMPSPAVSEFKKRPPEPSWVRLAKRLLSMMKTISTWQPHFPAPVRHTYSFSWKR